ncbi:MAG: ATP-binding protein [Candidatus Diapherotrites archaeon]|nr:ATP-binding protein [Candidatus Diapherotrites archaeon]
MRIAVTGGKGGTGKSTVATALAFELAKRHKVLLVDADVDCPDDHLILAIKRSKVDTVTKTIPVLDKNLCTRCGRCAEVCKMSAVIHRRGDHPVFIEEQCSGCGACMLACPVGAIGKASKEIGFIFEGEGRGVRLLSGELKVSEVVSEFVVNALKRHLKKIESGFDYVVIDTAAGTHCDVISALEGVKLAFAVTEPTPLGEHDLSLILELLGKLDVPAKVVLNRAGIAPPYGIKRIAERFGAEVAVEIPYSEEVFKAYSLGEPVKVPAIISLAERVEGMK